MIADILLIGPIGAGKSTQGKLLSEALQLPRWSMDELRFEYYSVYTHGKTSEETRDEILSVTRRVPA
jgi:adenylate kinase family enzyme